MSIFDKLLESRGIGHIHKNSKAGKLIRNRGVIKTKDFDRIYNLPKRDWKKFCIENDLVALMTDWLKTKNGSMVLWPEQAAALHDLYEYRGLFAPIAVGKGKALVSLLAGTVVGAKRPMILLPAQLREPTKTIIIPKMREHWRLPKKIEIIGYSEISLAKNHDLLFDINPDLIILDEAHYLKNKQSARNKKFTRFIKKNPGVKIGALSGTMTRKSLKDFWQLLLWCLDDGAPIPLSWRELQDWADALDSDIPDEQRLPPGALFYFCNDDKEITVREGFRKRLIETPGVVSSSKNQLGVSLYINLKNYIIPQNVRKYLSKLYNFWETPNGDYITLAIDLWRYSQQLSLGFWYKWDPPAPKEWLEARRAYKKFVRDTLKNNRRGLDSELQVWKDCYKNNVSKDHPWYIYENIKNNFKPNIVVEWIDKYAINISSKWLYERSQKEPGICWVEYIEFGKELSKISGCQYFKGGSGLDILKCDHSGIIASVKANSEGKNLQRYSHNLITSPFSSGKTWEQVLGRTHRSGQEADSVIVDVFHFTDGHIKSFEKALADAVYLNETMGLQKLSYATITKGGKF